MKRYFKYIFILVLYLLLVTGCDNKSNFKNPKVIEYKSDKGSIQLTYDNDGKYREETSGDYKILLNKDNNFRIDMYFMNNTTKKQQEESKKSFSKSSKYTIIDVNIGGYDGYALIDNKYTTAIVYLYLDKDVISYIKISPIKTIEAIKELEKGKKSEDVLYNQKKIQSILKTIKYTKK